MGIEHLRIPADQLTKVCDPDELGFETTEEVAPLEGTIGQERAISALELGLDLDEPGFNLFMHRELQIARVSWSQRTI